MSTDAPAYGVWTLVALNCAIFLIFAFSFFKPQTARAWRTFRAFVVALFVEMYSHQAGCRRSTPAWACCHTTAVTCGRRCWARKGIRTLARSFLGLGFYLLSTAWKVLFDAQRQGVLAVTGPYSRVRHPQYGAFVLVLVGFLLQWPTLLTLVMFPILLLMYGRLAMTEEAEMRKQFGAQFDEWAGCTPRFFPALGTSASPA